MIISHKHRFIFLRTTKTASTSLEIALSKFCGENDIITPISDVDSQIRIGLGYRSAQNYMIPESRFSWQDRLKVRLSKPAPQFRRHMQALEIKRYVPPEVWDDYYKFAFTRNPWDRVISRYFFSLRNNPELTLDEYITPKKLKRLKKRWWGLYTINGEIVADRVCRYENLNEKLEQLRRDIGLPEPIILPGAKTEFRKDRRSYRELLSEYQKNLIAYYAREEIAHFGYSF